MADEVFLVVDVVVGVKAVELREELVAEPGDAHEVLAGAVGDDDVLGLEDDALVLAGERLAVHVGRIAELDELFGGHTDFFGHDVGDGRVGGVEADGAVLEDVDVVDGAKEPLL